MKMRFKPGIIVVLLATFGVLSGCASIGQGSASGVDQQVVADLVTERTITRAFHDDPRLAGTNIIVGCVDGIVTLGGSVKENAQVQIAEGIALKVSGVESVRNAITS